MPPEMSRCFVLPWEEFIDNECLIEEIQKRPPLYTKEGAEYTNADLKRKLWEEVCELLFPATWDKLTAAQKTKTVRYVRQRWWNIRTCFTRELKAQQSIMSGQAPQKRRKYIYFEKLLFLLPTMDSLIAGSDPATAGDDVLVISHKIQTPSRPPDQRDKSKPKAVNDSLDKDKTISATDGEMNFALSLVPMLQSLSPEKRIAAQIEILQVFQKFGCGQN
ncbi:uncharacterized protein LOC126234995 [Schistocerca nitens]|uniref:uncharacterized protein LOC126234995 n=1 Tax=Schistocerca nitens TaxID=7011 RepID=UPI002118B9D1|nr:uncharacterized protein LOC126234995 [Schistocerca nitens]